MKDLTKLPFSSGDPLRNPFRDDVFSGDTVLPGTPQIHQNATRRCIQAIESMVSGTRISDESVKRSEIVLVSSPVAGYGKSHLIGRVSKSVLKSVTMLPLSLGPDPMWEDLLAHVIDYQSGKSSPQNPLASCFDETAGHFLSLLIRMGISRGVLNQKDCPVSVESLQKNHGTTFNDRTARKMDSWLKGKLTLLSMLPFPSDSPLKGFSAKDLLFWSRYFLKYLSDGRKFPEIPIHASEGESRERLIQFLRITSSRQPLLIVADHLDSCHQSDTAGMKIAVIVTTIADRIPNSLVILSLNRDLWESVFEQKIPSAYLDRLNRDALYLESITPDDGRLLVINRIHSQNISYHKAFLFAAALSRKCRWDHSETLSPRSVIRQAEEFWTNHGASYCDTEKPGHFPGKIKIESKIGPHFPPASKSPLNEPDPFGGHDLIYPDRPFSDKSPTPIAFESNRLNQSIMDTFSGNYPGGSTPNQTSGSQAGRRTGYSLPPNESPHPDPVPLHKDEPLVRPPAIPASKNGHNNSNGNSDSGIEMPEDSNFMGSYLLELERKYIQSGEDLTLDLPALEQFIKLVGECQASLVQNEVSINGGKSNCLRWKLSDYSVWIGFEPLKNIYYYSHILEKVLGDPGFPDGKMVCFSYGSERYDRKPYLATGLTNETLNRHFDIVHFTIDELAMIYAAKQLVRESSGSAYESEGLRIILIRLAPLWNRMCHPVKRNL